MSGSDVLFTSSYRNGTSDGSDLNVVRRIADTGTVPVDACVGAVHLRDIGDAIAQGRASAVDLGSMVVFQKRGMGVLVNFPEAAALRSVLR